MLLDAVKPFTLMVCVPVAPRASRVQNCRLSEAEKEAVEEVEAVSDGLTITNQGKTAQKEPCAVRQSG